MSQIYPLDSVIRAVDCSKPPDLYSSSEKLVIIDAKTGDILAKKPLMSFREIRCYVVSTQKEAENDVLDDSKVKDLATARAISLNITYQASCESGKEQDLVKALFKGDNPGAVVEQFIRQCLQDFVRDNKNNGINFIDGYFQGLKEKAQDYISQRANQEINLEKLTATERGLLLGWEVAHRSDKRRVSRKIFQFLVDETTFFISGLVALGIFWLKEPMLHSLPIQVLSIVELLLLCSLGIWIFVYADLKKGR